VLPLVPGYLSMVSGLSAAELSATGEGTITVATMRPMLRGIGLFIAGFTIVFVALGAVASGIGQFLHAHNVALTQVSGFVIVLLGVLLLLGALPARVWSHVGARPLRVLTILNSERRFDVRPSTLGTWAAPVMGMAFAFAWTPCLGPVLAPVLSLAANRGSLTQGVVLLAVYSLGLGLPFVATGLAFGRLTTVFARAKRRLWIVEVVAGVVLVGFGIILLTDHLGWVSGQFTRLMNDVGLGRLSRS
jgi:cytochrome c-type biogenesis protein